MIGKTWGKKICVHQWEKNGWRKCAKYILHLRIFAKYISHKHTHKVSFRHKKGGNSAIYHNMSRTWEHYAKWNKSERETQVLYDLTYMWNLTKQNQTKKKRNSNSDKRTNWWWLEAVGGEQAKWAKVVKSYKLATSKKGTLYRIVEMFMT